MTRKLLRLPASGYTAEEAAGTLCSYEMGNVSLPPGNAPHCSLLEMVDEELAKDISDFEKLVLRSPDGLADLFDKTDEPKTFRDPAFTDPHTWVHFVCELHVSGLIRFTGKPRIINGCFFVAKKPKPGARRELKFILDCRAANRLFRPPRRTLLGRIESLATLRLPGGAGG